MTKRSPSKASAGGKRAKPQPPPEAPSGEGVRARLATLMGAALVAVIGIALVTRIVQNEQSAPAPIGVIRSSAAPATPNAAALARRVALVSGHRGNDSGTVCPDGLTEAQVNYDHALRAAALLRAEGYDVEILDEFDPKLEGYRAAAFVSIHADSCTFVNNLATGFKVARSEFSALAEEEDRLVGCLKERYVQATGLKFHSNTITHDMTRYHAFRKIAPATPAVIIETGFLALDRGVLTRRADSVAKGIADGVLCFVRKTPS